MIAGKIIVKENPSFAWKLQNEEIVKKELEYLTDTFPKDDVWGITGTWFENMDQYIPN